MLALRREREREREGRRGERGEKKEKRKKGGEKIGPLAGCSGVRAPATEWIASRNHQLLLKTRPPEQYDHRSTAPGGGS